MRLNPARNTTRPISTEDALLWQVARYRIATLPATNAALYGGQHGDAAKKALARAYDAGYLNRFALGKRAVYQLTPQGCRRLGLPLSFAAPLRDATLLEYYSVLAFCTLQAVPRQRLMAREFGDLFPTVAQTPGIHPTHQAYYAVEEDATLKLGRLLVDCDVSPSRLRDKCRQVCEALLAGPLREELLRGRLVITVLTAYEAKQRALRPLLAALPYAAATAVEQVVQMRDVRA